MTGATKSASADATSTKKTGRGIPAMITTDETNENNIVSR